jgi:uncharacterized membrane protein
LLSPVNICQRRITYYLQLVEFHSIYGQGRYFAYCVKHIGLCLTGKPHDEVYAACYAGFAGAYYGIFRTLRVVVAVDQA